MKLRDANEAAHVYSADDLIIKPAFNAAAFHSQLAAKTFGAVLISASIMPSTQSLLQDNSRDLPHGTLCVADVQNSGRGTSSKNLPSTTGTAILQSVLLILMVSPVGN